MPIKKTLTFLLFIVFALNCRADDIRVLGKQSHEDTAHSYFLDLIQLALDKSSDKYPLHKITILDMEHTTQKRTLNLLEKEYVDIFWVGTNKEREKKFIPIRIPLFFGLLGYRVSVIHQDNFEQFNAIINEPEKLKSLTACQGQHWPDSNILQDNGFKVSRIARFDLMYKMINFKRCDYFPRAIFEGYSEIIAAQQQYPNLIIFDDIVIHYPFAMYFFVHKSNQALAEQLEYGLELAIQDGSLNAFMKQHTISKYLFPLKQWRYKKYIHLENNYMSQDSLGIDKKYWLTLFE